MEEFSAVPIMVTFEGNSETKQSKSIEQRTQPISKYSSEPKFRSYKQEILKIPKVKQILNKDKYVYNQDIEKRLELIGTVKNDNHVEEEIVDLHDLRKSKDASKKNKRHKTNFKIPLTRKNVESLNNLITKHIGHSQKYKNEEVIFLKQYAQSAPFDLEKLKFMDKIDKVKSKFHERYPHLNQKVLSRNQLVLENVILNRNLKREMKLDRKKQEKIHEKNVMRTLHNTIQAKKL